MGARRDREQNEQGGDWAAEEDDAAAAKRPRVRGGSEHGAEEEHSWPGTGQQPVGFGGEAEQQQQQASSDSMRLEDVFPSRSRRGGRGGH